MRIVLALLILVSPLFAQAQQAELLIFEETIHDFGTIQEEGGPVVYEFSFTNNSNRTVTILNVQASCGCTTPGWTKDPVPPKKEGMIKASFDPRGRPGYFNKTLTVTTDLGKTPIVLQIKGQVATEEMNKDNSRLTAAIGSLRLKLTTINFGKIYINKPPAVQEIILYNAGETPIAVQTVNSPAHIKVVAPDVIGVGARATLTLTYDPSVNGRYGFVSEKIELITDDVDVPAKTFTLFATVEEFFPKMDPAEAAKAPVLTFDTQTLNFGPIRSGVSVKREVLLRNSGKRDLIIHAIQPNCRCIGTTAESLTIKPGGEHRLSLTLTAEGRKGTQNKAVTFYANDPLHPVQRIAIIANVE